MSSKVAVSVGGKLAKPQLRGHLNDFLKKHLAIACVVGVGAGLAWKHLVAEPRKRAYAEFYRNYDPDADMDRMWNMGLFQMNKEIEPDE